MESAVVRCQQFLVRYDESYYPKMNDPVHSLDRSDREILHSLIRSARCAHLTEQATRCTLALESFACKHAHILRPYRAKSRADDIVTAHPLFCCFKAFFYADSCALKSGQDPTLFTGFSSGYAPGSVLCLLWPSVRICAAVPAPPIRP